MSKTNTQKRQLKMQNMSYGCSVFTVESDMLHFWAVQRGRNAWLLEVVLRCNRGIILASAVPEITSANGCTADSVLCLRHARASRCTKAANMFLIIFFCLCYRAQRHPITALPWRHLRTKCCSNGRRCPPRTGEGLGLW